MKVLGLSAVDQTRLLRICILGLISIVAIGSRLYSVLRFESVIHEFDPWFNYRTTKYLVHHGFEKFWNWFDESAWYPLGRVVGGTLYPGIMVTSAAIYNALHAMNIPVDIRNVCVFLAPGFSALTAIATYQLGKEVKNETAGLLAAAFMGVAPGYISRSVAGSYDNEGIAIFLLVLTFWLWLRAVRVGSAMSAAVCALSYFYMVSAWGGYVFIINLIPLHVCVLLAMGRFSNRLYVAYSTFYALGTLASMQVPFVGFQPTFTSEHMAALGAFGLIQVVAAACYVRARVTAEQFRMFVVWAAVLVAALLACVLVVLSMRGAVAPWTGRFYSLWDTAYAKVHIPIIASVSEHQPTAWPNFFFDLNVLIWLFPAGIYFSFRELSDNHVFLILYSVFAAYFAGVMVRLILTLTPIVCVLAGVAVANVFEAYLSRGNSGPGVAQVPRAAVMGMLLLLLCSFQWHSSWITSTAYSSPSVVLASRGPDGSHHIIDDFREAYYWLRRNTEPHERVLSWWDYGYQLAGMADRPTLVDNNTWNNTHIATVGRIMASDEDTAYDLARRHDVDYVLVVFGAMLGYSGDDINKFLWMIRIAQGVYPNDVREQDFFNSAGEYAIGDSASKAMRESLLHKLCYYRFGDVMGAQAFDRVRKQRLPSSVTLHNFEEAYTTENWMVRIYRVKKLDNFGRSHLEAAKFST
ncbi:oligosaccharyl transferase stt3 subunit [Coemansia sp. RSA 1972]|nr:oligosaccharyl transferase stt3 subunit [Coemansia sp. RSA 1972]